MGRPKGWLRFKSHCITNPCHFATIGSDDRRRFIRQRRQVVQARIKRGRIQGLVDRFQGNAFGSWLGIDGQRAAYHQHGDNRQANLTTFDHT